MGKKEQKRKSVLPPKTIAQKLKKRNWAKEFLTWKRERPKKLIEELRELGYLKDESKSKIREGKSPKRNKCVSKDKDSSS